MRHGVLRLFERLRGPLYVVPPFLLLWYALTGGRGWTFGVFAVAAAVAVAAPRVAPRRLRASPVGVLRFGAHFLQRSLEGGIDVAWRALHPGMPLVRREQWRQLDLPPGPRRTLFVAAACLLPGTLVCEDAGGRLLIHSISRAPQEKLDALEERVVAAFGGGRGEDAPP
jgi:multicomponent Na+:H+ antiporter subunit E